ESSLRRSPSGWRPEDRPAASWSALGSLRGVPIAVVGVLSDAEPLIGFVAEFLPCGIDLRPCWVVCAVLVVELERLIIGGVHHVARHRAELNALPDQRTDGRRVLDVVQRLHVEVGCLTSSVQCSLVDVWQTLILALVDE